jgi:hypothetical protein
MNKIFFLSALIVAAGILLACGNTSSATNAPANSNIFVVPANATASPTPAAVANIPANVATTNSDTAVPPAPTFSQLPVGTPTPGIDPKNAVIKLKPGAKPTPGIPDPETIRRQMQGLERPNGNANAALAPPGGGMMMQKKPVKPVPKPTQQ